MKRIIFILIVILAAALRLYRLSEVPPGVNRDEASIGFTAYSLMTTAKDEYGRFLPLSLESFGDWKLPLYIYTTIPFIKIFGLSELAVRLPSAIAGIASVGLLYYLCVLLFSSSHVGLLASLILAIMPWHIHISRVESEANVAILLILMGSLAFLKSLREKSLSKLIFSAILFALTYYTYHGNHIFTTLLILGLFVMYRKEIFRIPKWWIAGAVGGLVSAIILSATLFGADRTKISGISIFGDPTVIHNNIELPRLLYKNPNSLIVRLIYNRFTYAISTISKNYVKSYSPEFLFIKGGGNRAHNIQGFGNLHLVEAPLLLLGIAWLIANRKKKESQIILWWIAIGAVASAITKDAPHSNRMFAVVPALSIAAALGTMHFKKIAWIVLILCYSLSMTTYLNQYYIHFARSEAGNWGYAYKQLAPILFQSDKSVIMTKPETSPYIYLLFYSGYSPDLHQKQAQRYPISSDGFTDVSGFGRFSFRAIDWQKDPHKPNTLLVTDEVPGGLVNKILTTIYLPDGTPKFFVLDTDL